MQFFRKKKNINATPEQINAITLKDIYLGKSDGLKEAMENNFENYFYTGNNKYQELVSDTKKFIISGKKGTGKTILAKYFELEQNKLGNPTKILTERDAILKQFMEYGKKIDNSDEMDLFIEYSIYWELGTILLKSKKRILLKHPFHLIKIIKSFNYLNTIINKRNSIDNFYKEQFSVNTNTSEEYGVTGEKTQTDKYTLGANAKYAASKELTENFIKNPYFNLLDSLKQTIQYLLKFINVNIIYDDLDEYDEIITGNISFVKFFNSFLKVANRINSDIHITGTRYSRIIIIMRSDMLIPLNNNSRNLGKITADGQIKLNWLKKKYSPEKIHPLLEMVIVKIRNSNPLLSGLSDKEILKRFFPVKINGIDLTSYILNSTFGRPRDIINMLNTIKDENPNDTRFTKNSFQSTKLDYSEKCINELRNELSTHFSAEKIDECFYILNQINKREFWLSDIENVFITHRNEITHISDAIEFYEMCYEYGIIGNVWQREPGSRKKSYSWRFREDGNNKVHPDEKFCLHLALNKVLIQK